MFEVGSAERKQERGLMAAWGHRNRFGGVWGKAQQACETALWQFR